MRNMDTFSKARLRLTAWYLIIIIALSLSFSAIVYRTLTIEIHRFEKAQRVFIERRLEEGKLLPPQDRVRVLFRDRVPTNPELIEETEQRILMMLALANAGVLVITGGIGYFLAGRTLKPIREMLDEQGRFITDASHELKTPLTSLRAEYEAAMLDENKITKTDLKQLVKSSFEEIVNLQGLAEKMMQLTQQQKLKGHLVLEEVSFLEVVEGALNKVIPLAKQKHITINNEVDDYILKGEKQSLTELFVILLDNAIKYSPKGSEVLLASSNIDHHTQIEVTDKGMGIDDKDLSRIFERFWRADKSRSKVDGFGLGLSIAKEIAESHRGTISVESNPGEGTTFTLRFPIKTSS